MVIHSTIEGIALGILPDYTRAVAIFCAIIGHKPVEAFAMGLILLKDTPKKALYWILCVIYTLLTPAGIIIALWVSTMMSAGVRGIISSFSAGTFLFVGVQEWSEMFEHKGEWGCYEKSWHFGMFVLGIAWMLGIAVVEALYE